MNSMFEANSNFLSSPIALKMSSKDFKGESLKILNGQNRDIETFYRINLTLDFFTIPQKF